VVLVVREQDVHDEMTGVDDRAIDVEHNGELILGKRQSHPLDVRRERSHPVAVGHEAASRRSDALGR
jgi:hypothetical protein